MRRVTVTDLQGNKLGSITEEDGGHLVGEGKGQLLLDQAPGKTFDDWLDANQHSKYLRYVEQPEGANAQ